LPRIGGWAGVKIGREGDSERSGIGGAAADGDGGFDAPQTALQSHPVAERGGPVIRTEQAVEE